MLLNRTMIFRKQIKSMLFTLALQRDTYRHFQDENFEGDTSQFSFFMKWETVMTILQASVESNESYWKHRATIIIWLWVHSISAAWKLLKAHVIDLKNKIMTTLTLNPSSQHIQRAPLVKKQPTAWRATWGIHPSLNSWRIMASIHGKPVLPWKASDEMWVVYQTMKVFWKKLQKSVLIGLLLPNTTVRLVMALLFLKDYHSKNSD